MCDAAYAEIIDVFTLGVLPLLNVDLNSLAFPSFSRNPSISAL